MENILETIKTARINGGATLKNGKPMTYKTGYQVATDGVVVDGNDNYAIAAALAFFGYTAGLWFDGDLCYVDTGSHIKTKKEALAIGRHYNQLAVWDWARCREVAC